MLVNRGLSRRDGEQARRMLAERRNPRLSLRRSVPVAPDERPLDKVLGRLASLLRSAYGFTDVAIGERVKGGYANDLFHVTADGGESVLRVKYPPVHADDASFAALARSAVGRSAGAACGRGRLTYVSIEQRIAWLVPFVAGETADPAREQHRLAAVRALGRLHRAGSDIGVEPRPRQTPLRNFHGRL